MSRNVVTVREECVGPEKVANFYSVVHVNYYRRSQNSMEASS